MSLLLLLATITTTTITNAQTTPAPTVATTWQQPVVQYWHTGTAQPAITMSPASTGGDLVIATQGDPLILGLGGQLFQFDGRDQGWYANVHSPSLLWNMEFTEYNTCPKGENVFVSGIRLATTSTSGDGNNNNKNHNSDVLIKTTTPEEQQKSQCNNNNDDNDNDEVCLGNGTLQISFDGGKTFTSTPGDYHYGSSSARLVAHNTYAACSRKWHDYQVSSSSSSSSPNHNNSDNNGNLRGSTTTEVVVVEEEEEIPPLELLLENKKLTMVDIINPVECNEWIGKREQYGDLFDQRGLWSTVYIETPDVDFHIELRQSNPNNSNRPCKFQSLDVWMTRVSPKLQQEDWYGILGETKIPKLNEQTGEPILRDRYHILSSPRDEDYEVEGPYGTEFVAGPPVTNHQKGFLWTSLWKTSNNNHNNKIIKKQPQPQQLSGGGGGGGGSGFFKYTTIDPSTSTSSSSSSSSSSIEKEYANASPVKPKEEEEPPMFTKQFVDSLWNEQSK